MIRRTSHKVMAVGLSAIALGIALAGCGGNNTSDNTAPTGGGAINTDTPSAAPGSVPSVGTATGAASSASFKSAAAMWSKVMVANADLDKVIKSKNLKTVHEAAFKVRDLVKLLPAESQGLSPDKQKTLADQVKNVEQLAGLLDEAGDSNNLKDTQENQAGLNDALDIIQGLYPAGALK